MGGRPIPNRYNDEKYSFAVKETMEREFIEWLRERHKESKHCDKLQIAIGDDAAVFSPAQHDLVVASDSIADGTHFDCSKHSLRRIGRKAIAVNLSDVASMGGRAKYATLSFFVPRCFSIEEVKEIFNGAADIADSYSVTIIGGDTNSWDGRLVVGANVIGECRNVPWKIGNAKPGDAILVTGCFGGSILGHHLDFEPRCDLANHFSASGAIHAATDVTDSLSIDLAQMCRLSGVGAEIELANVPISDAASRLAKDGSQRKPIEHALYDGEDFELLFAIDGERVDEILKDDKFGDLFTVIGKFVSGSKIVVIDGLNSRDLFIDGYRH